MLKQKINEHVKVYMTGVLTGSQTEKYVENLDDGIGMMVSYENDDHKRTLLFKGLVTQIRIKMVANVSYLVVEAVSYTSQMDEKPCRRSFQNKKMKYKALLEQVMKDYPQANCAHSFKEEMLQGFTLQFDETDWAFLKRMVSRFGSGLIPDPLSNKPQFYFGLPDGNQKAELKQFNYSICLT
ncbi:hypothetical protein [Paenibacillus glacialis]|uniref:hypothetical protein n=1 Tax=Paenibacillus glacialis TaxID=494026 RepID=UPI001FDFF356|nr:hypothetical protein [Paenibacillus glacialis]